MLGLFSRLVKLDFQIQEALVDKPNVIVVLDDVVQQETVTWASQLGLRFLVTTRNAELFASVSCSVDVVHVGSLTVDEGKELFFAKGTPEMEESEAAQSAVNHALSVCSGNAALLNMLKKLSSGEPARLSMFVRRLVERGLSSVKVATPYEYKSMHDSLTVSVGRLSSEDRDTLACAAILPSEVDIPLAVRMNSASDQHCEVQISQVPGRRIWESAGFGILFGSCIVLYICAWDRFMNVRFLVTVLVAITFGLFLIVLSTGLHRPLLPYDPLLWLFTLYIVMCYQWNRLFGAYLTRTQRATFDEWNIMETYQPRALTMGHLFDVRRSRDCGIYREPIEHYANEYTIVEQMAKERKLMEGTGKDASAAAKFQLNVVIKLTKLQLFPRMTWRLFGELNTAD
ncbi:unnamed protein product [Nippostrongylus brasiliensis]|uniref:NB-ARC domain-containing protein n=1 Tax=Nippostrongylus brasiliensis TaxID=27835 RepID=A0A3P7DD19_NIPBR|nr:unnamed protein product [Nippostrongylus brasiliensis]